MVKTAEPIHRVSMAYLEDAVMCYFNPAYDVRVIGFERRENGSYLLRMFNATYKNGVFEALLSRGQFNKLVSLVRGTKLGLDTQIKSEEEK